jgi:prepilin-type N-terminal cleavage/methylation domain-containing protein/prepilin-type processing-associated H-X9-DG protein
LISRKQIKKKEGKGFGMNKKKGFTLIELLVVIAIIALLMGILMPALQAVKNQARAAVCQTYLKTWGTMFNMYCDGNNRKMPDRSLASGKGRWMYSLRDLIGDSNDLKLCPQVKKSSIAAGMDAQSWWGSTVTAWEVPAYDAGGGREVGTYGSYGINGYCYNTRETLMGFATVPMHWKTPDVQGAAYIPLFMDAMFWTGWPQATNSPRPEPIMVGTHVPDEDGMQRYCLDRHNGRINAAFFDFSVRPVGLKELWTLNWHRGYDRTGPWTRAGGVTSGDWPEWMREFKEY